MEKYCNEEILQWRNIAMEKYCNGEILQWRNIVMEKYCNALVAEAVSPVTKIIIFYVIDDRLKEISRNSHGEI
jgi:hypothetical protein